MAKKKHVRADPSQSAEGGGFDMTPMIDVVFLLIIFFMCVTELSDASKAKLQLPIASNAEEDVHIPGRVIINVLADGTREVMGQEYDDVRLKQLLDLERATSMRAGDEFPTRAILIRADRTTAFEDVEHVMAMCMEAKLWRIAFATKDPNAPGG